MFNLAIDSKLRGCDVVAIRVEDVAASGYTADRATVRQRKTGRPVRFELSEQTRQAVDDYLKAANKRPGEFLFTGRRGAKASMTTRQYARLALQLPFLSVSESMGNHDSEIVDASSVD
jgi:integrase